MRVFDAWWLPGFEPKDDTTWWTLESGGVTARSPRLTVADMHALAERLREHRRDYLRRLTVQEIADKIGAAINRWLDPFSPFLYEACRLIPAFSGYPEEAVRKGLGSFLGGFRSENLRRLLREELGEPEILDGFRPKAAAPGLTRAIGPELVVHSFAGNTPGLPAQSLVCAMLVKAACIGKLASEEPVFGTLFARSIASVDPSLADCLALSYWPGEEASRAESPAAAAFEAADLVVAYGSDEAIDAVRSHVPPRTRLISYGHRVSFGLVARERLARGSLAETAARAAYDVVRFDQQSCLSPHLFYVEEGGENGPVDFARVLAGELSRWSSVVPRGRLTVDERVRAAEVRRSHEFRAATGSGALFGGASDEWCVLLEHDPAFAASCLNRTVWVKPLDDVERLPDLLGPVRGFIQTAGLAAGPERLEAIAELLARLGLDRVCPLGQMGDPPITWRHDGRFNLLDFLRFTDLEPESSAGRWEFGHPEQGLLGMNRHVAQAQDGGGRRD